MKKDKNGNIVITRKKASELFLLLSNARFELQGKMKTTADKYWKELEKVLGLDPTEETKYEM